MSLEAFRRASLMTRTLITVLSLLTVFTIFIGTLSLVAVAATKKAFPAAEAEQPLASPAGAGEAEARPGKKPRSKGDRTE
ncbi:MAG: hypothetical protein HOW73_08815 [Polyangiaceae bacterium]|nr:hypothetical protein [Polyangiaceae bacterium]